MSQFSTAALAAAAGLQTEAVAEYQRRRLLPAPSGREPGFGLEHVKRAQLLSRLEASGMSPDLVERLLLDRTQSAERLLELRGLVLDEPCSVRETTSVQNLISRFGDFQGKVLDQAIEARLLIVRADGLIDVPSPPLLDVAERVVEAGLSLTSAVTVATVVQRGCLSAASEFLRVVIDELWRPLQQDYSDARLEQVANKLHELRSLASSVFEAMLPIVLAEVFDRTFAEEFGISPSLDGTGGQGSSTAARPGSH